MHPTASIVIATPSHVTFIDRQSGQSGFFDHHGLWAPGVRLFRRLKFRSKAVLIMIAMAVPIAMLGAAFVQSHFEILRTVAVDLQGVAYAKEVVATLRAMGEHEKLSLATAVQPSGEQALQATAALQALQLRFSKVEELDKSFGATIGTHEALAKARDALVALVPPSEGIEKVYAANRKLGLALSALVVAVSDGSGLTLDPELDTYYLSDAGVLRLPITNERLGRMTAFAAALAAAGAPTEGAAKELLRLDTLVDLESRSIVSGMAKVIRQHPEARDALDAAPVKHMFEQLRQEASDQPGSGGPAKSERIYRMGNEAAMASWTLQARAMELLKDLLEQRIDDTQRQLWIVGGLTSGFVLLAAYLFISFYRVMDGGLNETRRHLRAMTAGDLTMSPAPWGQDEAAQLMLELRIMQDSLRKMVQRVRDASDEIVKSSSEIAQGAMDLSTRTEQAAANLEESAAAMEEIGSTTKIGLDNTDEAARVARENAQAAANGSRVMNEVAQTMDGIRAASTRIGEIIGTIDSIAFQTNILALNAAVEAARAGEQGRGFAVVASEVRSLAKRSADAAREIKGLIASSGEQVERGNGIVRRAGSAIDGVVATSQRVDQLLGEVSHGAREQSLGISQMGQAVSELDRMTQQNAALVEQTAAAASTLKDLAVGLATEVAEFRLPSSRDA
jgi:methyl-accepting chemotaxis protein